MLAAASLALSLGHAAARSVAAAKAATNKRDQQGRVRDVGHCELVGLDAHGHGDREWLHRGVQQGISRHQGQLQAGLDPDWQAALTPALRSDSGPDVFDMQPGSYVSKYGSFAEDMTPVITKALGDDWQSKVAPAGVSGLTDEDGS